jgi:hypothetical protein
MHWGLSSFNFVTFRTQHTRISQLEEQVNVEFCVQLGRTFLQIYDMNREAYEDKPMG